MDWDVVATWRDGWLLRRLPDTSTLSNWQDLRLSLEHLGRPVIVVGAEVGTDGDFHDAVPMRQESAVTSGVPQLNLVTGRLLWFARETGILCPENYGGDRTLRLVRPWRDFPLLLPGKLPPEEGWLFERAGAPSTRDQAAALVRETAPGLGLSGFEDKGEWIGLSLYALTTSSTPWSLGVNHALVLWRKKDGLFWVRRSGVSGSSRGNWKGTLSGALRHMMREEGYLSAAEWEAWWRDWPVPGVLALDEEQLGLFRMLGEPSPLLRPWAEFEVWARGR